jgi:hypothetical protein
MIQKKDEDVCQTFLHSANDDEPLEAYLWLRGMYIPTRVYNYHKQQGKSRDSIFMDYGTSVEKLTEKLEKERIEYFARQPKIGSMRDHYEHILTKLMTFEEAVKVREAMETCKDDEARIQAFPFKWQWPLHIHLWSLNRMKSDMERKARGRMKPTIEEEVPRDFPMLGEQERDIIEFT